jgi:tyrosine-protein phosphatase YwqE
MRWTLKRDKSATPSVKNVKSNLTDLHSHVLPGLDHGAQDKEEALALLKSLAKLGFRRVVGTPHFNNQSGYPSLKEQQKVISELSQLIEQMDMDIELLPGAELPFNDLLIGAIKNNIAPGIGPCNAYLVEFGLHPGSVPSGIEDLFFKLQLGDRQVILAHAERIPDFQRDISRLETIRRSGALVQVDLMSLVGRYGRQPKKVIYKLLEKGVADLAATDLHHLNELRDLEKAMEKLRRWDMDTFSRLVSTNPELVLAGRSDEINNDA